MTSSNITYKDRALPMAARGVLVGRLAAQDKVPLDKSWQALMTTDADQIIALDAETPAANCMCVATPDTVAFLEIDEQGVKERYEKETGEKFPDFFEVCSREGRYHEYMLQTPETRACGNISQKELVWGSFRQDRQYVVSPLSIHPVTKKPYTIVNDVPLISPPKRFVEWLVAQRTKVCEIQSNPNLMSADAPIPLHQHDITLFAIACKLREDGLEYEEMLPIVMRHAERCEGRGSDWKNMVENKCRSACKYPAGNPGPTVLIGGKVPGQASSFTQASTQDSVVPVTPTTPPQPVVVVAKQLPVGEGEEQQWQDIFGIIHPGLMPPEVLEDTVVDEDFAVSQIGPLNWTRLLNKKRLKKEMLSWLHANAIPLDRVPDMDWLVDQFFIRGGFSIWCGEQGTFKSILALFFARALLEADHSLDKQGVFLGRCLDVTSRNFKDTRPLRIYYVDNDSAPGLTKRNCEWVGLKPYMDDGTFIVFGGWEDHPILTVDDPRLIEAAKRDRAVFVIDCLNKVSEGLDLSNPRDSNYIMSKGTRLAYLAEGVLFLHHDNKIRSGYTGSTPIVSVPDMSFTFSRPDKRQNVVTIIGIRTKGTSEPTLRAELFFSEGGIDPNSSGSKVLAPSVTYRTTYDSQDPETRKTEKLIKESEEAIVHKESREQKAAKAAKAQRIRDEAQRKSDEVIILRALKIIKERERGGCPPMNACALAKAAGVTNNRIKQRVFCVSLPESLRPWLAEVDRKKSNSLLFCSDEKQQGLFEKAAKERVELATKAEAEEKEIAAEWVATEAKLQAAANEANGVVEEEAVF